MEVLRGGDSRNSGISGENALHHVPDVFLFQNWHNRSGRCEVVWRNGRVSAFQKNLFILIYIFAGGGNYFNYEALERKNIWRTIQVFVSLFVRDLTRTVLEALPV